MSILVTGGAGYIGSVAVERLLRAGHRVAVLDNLSTGHRAAVPEGVPLVKASLLDRERLESALRENDISAVMHFAAVCEVGESVRDPAKYYRHNVVGSLCLLEAMSGCGVKQIVFSSSAAVYGEPEAVPIREDAACCPTNPYGRTKKMFEETLADHERAAGIRWASLRYFNAAGASEQHGEDHDPESHLIPLVLRAARGQISCVEVFGDDYATKDGTCIRDYVHVEDLAEAHILALAALEAGRIEGRAFNLGSGSGFSVLEVVRAAEEVTGKSVPVRMAGRRAGDPARLVASSERIRAELGWNPKHTDIREIIDTAWRWHTAHPNGYGGGGGE